MGDTEAANAENVVDLAGTAPPPDWGVVVDGDAIAALADAWASTEFVLPDFSYPGTPPVRDERWWFDYVALAVSVLACLWPPEGDEVWHFNSDGQWLDDAPGIFAAFSGLVEEGGIDLAALATMDDDVGAAIFAGRGTLQLVLQRVDRLRQVASTIQQRWDGSVRNLVDEADRNAVDIVSLLVDTMPGYFDRPLTEAGTAHFDKLAYLATALMAGGCGWSDAGFHGFENVPVYPDYMLPRVFRHSGAMVYSTALATAVDQRQLIAKDSNEEHAIRWATVHCGAQLSRALTERGATVTGPALDYQLWSVAVLGPNADQFGEHHRTITLSY